MINQVTETVKESINEEYISTNQLDTIDATNNKFHSFLLLCACRKGNMSEYIMQNILNQEKVISLLNQ